MPILTSYKANSFQSTSSIGNCLKIFDDFYVFEMLSKIGEKTWTASPGAESTLLPPPIFSVHFFSSHVCILVNESFASLGEKIASAVKKTSCLFANIFVNGGSLSTYRRHERKIFK